MSAATYPARRPPTKPRSGAAGVDHAGDRRGAAELAGHRIHAVLRVGQLGERPALVALVGFVDGHVALEVGLQALVGLAVAVERPHQLRLAEREPVARLAVVAPGVPGV